LITSELLISLPLSLKHTHTHITGTLQAHYMHPISSSVCFSPAPVSGDEGETHTHTNTQTHHTPHTPPTHTLAHTLTHTPRRYEKLHTPEAAVFEDRNRNDVCLRVCETVCVCV